MAMDNKDKSTWIKVISVFVLLVVLVWIDELFDFPEIFFGIEQTRANWPESVMETILIVAVGFFTVSRLFPRKRRLLPAAAVKEKHPVWGPIVLAFVVLCLVIWLNEIIDLPYLLLKGEKTPINWPEALVETIVVLIVGIFAVSILIRSTAERSQVQDLFFTTFYFNPIPATITSLSEGRIMHANKAFFTSTGYTPEDINGKSIRDLNLWAQPSKREEIVRELIEAGTVRDMEVQVRDARGDIRTSLYSAQIINYLDEPHILAMAIDITDRKKAEEALVHEDSRLEALLKLNQMIDSPEHELTHFAMEEGVRLTGSTLGYIAFSNEDESVFSMYAWSAGAMKECTVKDKSFDYPLTGMGLWGEAVRQRRPVITNDYQSPNIHKKGVPAGHVTLVRHMNVPIFDGSRIVVVAGVANKETDYDEADVRQLTLLMSGMWRIIQRKQAEESFLKAEAKYRNMFMHMMNGVAAYKAINDGKDFIFIDLNKAAEEIDNVKKEDVLGKRVLEIFPGIHDYGLLDVLQRVWTTGRSEHFPLTYYKDDRIEGWRENYVYKLPSGELIAVYSDETLRKKTEEELYQRQRELVTLLGNLPGMAYRCRNDKDWTMEFISEGCTALTGYAPSDLVGNKKISYGQLVHPDDRDMVRQSVQSAVRERKHFQMTYRIITAGGRERWVWEQGIGIFSAEGTLVSLEGFILDTTAQRLAQSELRRSEEKFSKAFHASPDWITISTLKDGIYIDVNEAFLNISGYSLGEVIGRSAIELGIWEQPEDREAMVSKVREQGGVRNQEARLRTKQGVILTMLWSAEQFEFGGEACILSIIRDITDRKNMEERLRHSGKQLRELYKYLQESIEEERTRISREIHDVLGQELTVLGLDLAYLTRKIPQDRTELLQRSAQMSQHIEMSIESVRRISMNLRPPMLDQLGLVSAIQWQAEDFRKRTGTACTLKIDPTIVVKNRNLSTAVFRVFQETLTNITRHAHATEVLVELSRDDDSLALTVSDNGVGIQKEKILNPKSFGLIGMRERVKDWGGDIQISGRKGRGTTVKVTMPVKAKKKP